MIPTPPLLLKFGSGKTQTWNKKKKPKEILLLPKVDYLQEWLFEEWIERRDQTRTKYKTLVEMTLSITYVTGLTDISHFHLNKNQISIHSHNPIFYVVRIESIPVYHIQHWNLRMIFVVWNLQKSRNIFWGQSILSVSPLHFKVFLIHQCNSDETDHNRSTH